jgi:metallo-beta-lactamase class B
MKFANVSQEYTCRGWISRMTCASFLICLLVIGLWAQSPAPAPEDEEYRSAPVGPFRIIGNIYYVGPSLHLASYLIKTPEGNILIDTNYEESVAAIRQNIEKLGFSLKDTKIILASHSHGDHIAGHALMKELTGATVLASEADALVMRSGGKDDFREVSGWKPIKVDRTLKNGEQVKLGGTTLVAHLTPGHTKGCTTWSMVTEEQGQKYNVVFLCGVRMNPGIPLIGTAKYPNMAQDFALSFKKLNSLPCDVFLGAHGYWFGLGEKIKRLKQGDANPFIDPQGFRAYVQSVEREFVDQLKREGGKL